MTAEAVCTAEDGVMLQGRAGVPRVLSLPREDQHVSCAVQCWGPRCVGLAVFAA